MRDGGKGDAPRPIGIPLEKFDMNWDEIFGGKRFESDKWDFDEKTSTLTRKKNLEPIPFAGMVDTGDDTEPVA
jgi:hypothetical protein